MIPVPKLFRKTKSVKRIHEYMDTVFNEVLHTTLNPNGPGASHGVTLCHSGKTCHRRYDEGYCSFHLKASIT